MNDLTIKSRDYVLIEKMRRTKVDSQEYVALRNEFFFLYRDLVNMMKGDLISRAIKIKVMLDYEVEEYEVFAFDKLVQAINSIDLDKITTSHKFCLYIQYWGYLRSMNRDLMSHRIKLRKNETQIFSVADTKNDEISSICKKYIIENQTKGRTISAEDECLQNLKKSVINKAVDYCLNKKFNDIQKQIFLLKTDNKTIKYIIEELEIKGSIYYKELKNIRSILKTSITKISEEDKVDVELSFI